MKIQFEMDYIIILLAIIVTSIGSLFILRYDWKRYGTLFLLSAFTGEIICYVFIKLGLYNFPIRFFPSFSPVPVVSILTAFPYYVLLGVRYSPRLWPWKIPFYWVLVHVGMIAETWLQNETDIIAYLKYWDAWDSYTWWWIYLLVFEWVGGLLIPADKRKPLNHEWLQYGKIGWFLLHFILILSIFLGGFYIGRVTK